jgi:hypothetical protein
MTREEWMLEQARQRARQPSESEVDYFTKNPGVSGMADFDSGTTILNPLSELSDEEKDSVLLNEFIRIMMRERGLEPDFDLTEKQASKFKDYGDSRSKKETVIGRILSGDPSALDVTDQQRSFAETVKSRITGDVAAPGKSGYSKRMKVGGQWGKFDWSTPPRYSPNIGSGKSPMYLFVQEDGEAYWRRLESARQGGRWEEAHHAPAEWEVMLSGDTKAIDRMWGDSLIAEAFRQAAARGLSFDEMKEFMKDYNTWRQISGD